ncbi:MAG TPA: ornithine cyclodeaminase family protein [Gaiellaceae bacterium]|nr:ornithine cyclodeaminase family protein [Gaiellaceae bacterium]
MPVYLSEHDVESLLSPGEAVPVVEACFLRLAGGTVENVPRKRLPFEGGSFAIMAAVDRELGLAGVKSYAVVEGKAAFVVCLFGLESGALEAVVEADALGRFRTGAASGVAAKYLARTGARTLGVIGCGAQAQAQVEAIRAAVPGLDSVLAYCRTPERLAAFCAATGAEAAEGQREVAGLDVVVTITTSRDPVLRGDWLSEGAFVAAVGANRPDARELDNVVLERATFVCCDSREQARLESGDLIEPVAGGVLDWLEVHELQDVVAGELRGREGERDIVLFKSNGLAAWDVAVAAAVLEQARERGVGREL